MSHKNSSELGHLAALDRPAAARRIYDALSVSRTYAAAAEYLGVTEPTYRKWSDELADECLAEGVAVPAALPHGDPLPASTTLAEGLARLRAYHRDPQTGAPLPDEQAVRKALRALIDRIKVHAPDAPKNLEELGRAVGVDRFRLSKYAANRISLPDARIRALATYLKVGTKEARSGSGEARKVG